MTAMARPALLYFLLWLGVTLSSTMDLEKRIIGGQPCHPDDRRYHVKVLPKSCTGVECHCGGSLIRDQWVLSAAHCVLRGDTVRVVVNVHPGTEREEMDIAPADVRLGPNEHDIVLLKLPKKPNKIYKTAIPSEQECQFDIKDKDKFQVAGHGPTAYDPKNEYINPSPTQLMCLNMVPVVACPQSIDAGLCPLANIFCAKDTGKQTAPGDSGGGALFNTKVYGIVRGGHPPTAAQPFYFVRVCSYRVWIENTAVP